MTTITDPASATPATSPRCSGYSTRTSARTSWFAAARRAGADCPSWCRLAGGKPDDDDSARDFHILYQGGETVIERAHDTDSETMRPADAARGSRRCGSIPR